jgi:hypothetical protein
MGVALSEDPYEAKRNLTGVGQPVGLRNIPMRDSLPTPPGERPPIYVTSQGIASTDPSVGNYNRDAMRSAASPALGGGAPPSGAAAGVSPGVAQAATAEAGAASTAMSGLRKVGGGLRAFGVGLAKAAAPGILAKDAVDTAVTDTSESDARLKALGMSTSGDVANQVNTPLKSALRYASIPFVGPALSAAANMDPQFAGDLETRGKQALMGGLGLNGTADRKIAQSALTVPNAATATTATPAVAASTNPYASNNTLRGSYAAPGQPQAGASTEPDPSNPSTVLDSEISKIGRNPFKGVRGSFFNGGGDKLASNVADELNQRARVRALQEKYSTDATIANSSANVRLQAMQLQQSQANKNQDELKSMFDRTATVPVTDPKTGQTTGSTVDPALRNRAEDFARNAVAGWDQLSPEQRSQGFEGVRHKFLLQELA